MKRKTRKQKIRTQLRRKQENARHALLFRNYGWRKRVRDTSSKKKHIPQPLTLRHGLEMILATIRVIPTNPLLFRRFNSSNKFPVEIRKTCSLPSLVKGGFMPFEDAVDMTVKFFGTKGIFFEQQ